MCIKIFLFSLSLMFLLNSCSSIPTPFPKEERIKCFIVKLNDLTGISSNVDPEIETILNLKLFDDYAKHFEKGPTQNYDKTIYITNLFYPVKDEKEADIIITGTIEQISYGQPNEISKYIVDAWLFGLWGIAARDNALKTTRAAFVEYNFNILSKNIKFGKVNIQGAYQLSKSDRQMIIKKANEIAAEELVFQLNDKIAERLGKKPKYFFK